MHNNTILFSLRDTVLFIQQETFSSVASFLAIQKLRKGRLPLQIISQPFM